MAISQKLTSPVRRARSGNRIQGRFFQPRVGPASNPPEWGFNPFVNSFYPDSSFRKGAGMREIENGKLNFPCFLPSPRPSPRWGGRRAKGVLDGITILLETSFIFYLHSSIWRYDRIAQHLMGNGAGVRLERLQILLTPAMVVQIDLMPQLEHGQRPQAVRVLLLPSLVILSQ